MTISSTSRTESYAGNDALTSFGYNWLILADEDIAVYLIVDSTGVATLQTLTTHYTVTGTDNPEGGTVEMVTPPATGETLYLERRVTLTQDTDLRNQGTYRPQSVEDAIDRVLMAVQQEAFDTPRFEQTLPDDATPSVAGGYSSWHSAGTTTITDLDDGVPGQLVTIRFSASREVTDGSNLNLAGSFSAVSGDMLMLRCRDGTIWDEVSRGSNG